MTERTWDPIEDLFGDSNELVASNSFTANSENNDNLFNDDELDENELLGIEETDPQDDIDDFGLDDKKSPLNTDLKLEVKFESVDKIESPKQKLQINQSAKSPETIGRRSSAEVFFEQELDNLGPDANIYTDLNYEEPDYDNLLDYDEEDDLESETNEVAVTQVMEIEMQVTDKVVTPIQEITIDRPVPISPPAKVVEIKGFEVSKLPVEVVNESDKIDVPVKKIIQQVVGEKLVVVKGGEIDEDDLESENEDEDGVRKKRGRSNYWSERAENSSPVNETDAAQATGNKNFNKNFNNNPNRNNNNNNNRGGYQNGQNNGRFNNNNNGYRNNFQQGPNNFNNFNGNNKFNNNVPPMLQQNNQTNALLPLPNLSNFNSNNQPNFSNNNLGPKYPMPHSNQTPLFQGQHHLQPQTNNDKFRVPGQMPNYTGNVQMQPQLNGPLQQRFPSNFQTPRQIGPNIGINHQQMPLQNNQLSPLNNTGYLNPRTDHPMSVNKLPPHNISPNTNTNFNTQNTTPNQFQNNFNNNMSNFSHPGLLPTPSVQQSQYNQNNMYQIPPVNNFQKMNTYNSPQSSGQFNNNMNANQPIAAQFSIQQNLVYQQVSQPQVKPSSVYINPSFIAKQKKMEEEQNRKNATPSKETSFVKQRSRKDLEALLEKRLADEMKQSSEVLKPTKSTPTKLPVVSTGTKRKSYENKSDHKYPAKTTPVTNNTVPPPKKLMSKVTVAVVVAAVAGSPTNMIIDDPEYSKKVEEQKRKRDEILKMKEEKRIERIRQATALKNKGPMVVKDTRRVEVTSKAGQELNKRVVNVKPVVIS